MLPHPIPPLWMGQLKMNEWLLFFHTRKGKKGEGSYGNQTLGAAERGNTVLLTHMYTPRPNEPLSAESYLQARVPSVWIVSCTIWVLQPLPVILYRSASQPDGKLLDLGSGHMALYKEVRPGWRVTSRRCSRWRLGPQFPKEWLPLLLWPPILTSMEFFGGVFSPITRYLILKDWSFYCSVSCFKMLKVNFGQWHGKDLSSIKLFGTHVGMSV